MARKTNYFRILYGKLGELPMARIAEGAVGSVLGGKVTIITSGTGSGKTLYGTGLLADSLDDGRVVVLVPRRFLAADAAEAIADITKLRVGEEVGFAVGTRGEEQGGSKFGPKTKLLFTTYGYAIASGLINTAQTVVLDEVHEAGIDITLAKALLHQRIKSGEQINIVEMSATMDAQHAANYWSDVRQTAIHQTEGKTFPCEQRTVDPQDRSLAKTAIDLIQKDGRKGIAVFCPGRNEVQNAAEGIKAAAKKAGIDNLEIGIIYGEMSFDERARATKPPKEGNIKVLVGTNVIESGMNIPWLDAGISDGVGKIDRATKPNFGGKRCRKSQIHECSAHFFPGLVGHCGHWISNHPQCRGNATDQRRSAGGNGR